jgi:hypothetical protein
MASNKTELRALKKLITEADLILSTTDLPQNRTARCRELLKSALALTDDLINQAKLPAAALLGQNGGSVTAKRGSDYFRKLAARRKTHGGGRPPKTPELEITGKTGDRIPVLAQCSICRGRTAFHADGRTLDDSTQAIEEQFQKHVRKVHSI